MSRKAELFRRLRYAFLFLMLGLVLLLVQFVFNPLGLGPVPERLLTDAFYAHPLEESEDVQLLVDGREAFDAIIDAIDVATVSIYVQTYIWKDDTIGGRVAARLRAAADRGVRITVSKDVLGTVFELGEVLSGQPSPVFTEQGLRGHDNVEVTTDPFSDVDHSKYFIFDGRSVIFGGMNIADEYHTEWHDFMIAIHNARFTRAFQARVLDGEDWPAGLPVILGVNDRKATEIRTGLLEMIDQARETLVLEHAYFSDGEVIAAVVRAAERGVAVDVILPKEPDTHVYANMATINQLLASTNDTRLRLFLFPRMMHSKVVLADGTVAAIGSANLTPRSMITSKEVTLFVSGTPQMRALKQLRQRLAADMAESEQVQQGFSLGWTERLGATTGKYVW